MARSRYGRLGTVDGGRALESFIPESTNAYRNDAFSGVNVRKYTVKRGDRLDHLAAQFLNDDEYWWAIALVSDLVSPFLEPGQKILIPVDVQEVLDRL